MSWLKRLLGMENTAPVVAVPEPVTVAAKTQTAPGTSISYDPKLIDCLLEDHKKIFALYHEIAANVHTPKRAVPLLEKFRTELHGHILVENTRFYIYVERTLEKIDPESAQIAREFKKEMNKIARAVEAYLTKYIAPEWTAEMLVTFPNDTVLIGQALTERVKHEESRLYPLYCTY